MSVRTLDFAQPFYTVTFIDGEADYRVATTTATSMKSTRKSPALA